jgi:hypothetical protein
MIAALAIFAMAGTGWAFDDNGGRRFRERLNGLKEAAAVVSTTGNGTFQARINDDGTRIDYTLTFRELEGDVRQAHIHIGHPQNTGGIVLWLCQTAASPDPTVGNDTPQCDEDEVGNFREGRVSHFLTSDDVQNLPANGIAGPTPTTEGEFEEVLRLIRAGRTYVNVHSAKFPPGEIRSQIDNRDDDDHGGDDRRGSDHH